MSNSYREKYDEIKAIQAATRLLLEGNISDAQKVIAKDYPFMPMSVNKRTYSIDQKMVQFKKDGFIDRYSGKRLVNPGILRIISVYLPNDFPYHPHWKMTDTHIAFWELFPTIDHVIPIARGGKDEENNWVTTSMLNNSIKSNWTLEQMQWTLHPPGDINEWDGLTKEFIDIVQRDRALIKVAYIKQWYDSSLKSFPNFIY